MTRRHLGKAAAVIFLASMTFLAMAQPQGRQARQPRGPMGGDWWNNPQTIETLELDEATRASIQEEVHKSKLQMIDLKADVERAHLQFQQMLHADPMPSDRELERQVDQLVGAQSAVMREEILLRAHIMTLLTPEQRAGLEELHQQRRQHMREMRQNRLDGRQQPEPEPEPLP